MSVSAGARVQRRTSGLSDKARKRIEITILSLPALIMFLGFVILPVFMAGYYGFFKWKGYGKPTVNGQFIGFENYKVILTDPNFQQALGHTRYSWSSLRSSSRGRWPSSSPCCSTRNSRAAH